MDCEACDEGTVHLRRCPHALAPTWAKRVCELAMWASSHGVMPVAGGLHDQSNWYMEAQRIVLSEKQRIEAEERQGEDDGAE